MVQEIVPDPREEDMFIAVNEPGSYLDLGDPVSFRHEDEVVERGLLDDHGVLSGRAQAAVRPLSASDFATIIERGLGSDADILPRVDQIGHADGFADPKQDFLHWSGRDRVNQLTNRAVRNRNFRKTVLRGFDECCAITG